MERTKKQQSTIIEIEKGISFGKASSTIFEVTKDQVEPDTVKKFDISNVPWALWGKKNNFPQDLINENKQEVASSGALKFKINAHFGKGLYFYRQQIKDNQVETIPILFQELPPEIKEFFFLNNILNFQQGIIKDYEWFHFYYVQYIPNATRNKIIQVKWQRVVNTRSAKIDSATGVLPGYYLSGKWPTPDSGQYALVPAFDVFNPFSSPNAIYKHQLPSVDRDYYPEAEWHSNLRWLSVAKKIPQWIGANIDNSANIKYHVEIPEQYFIDLYPEGNYKSLDECLKARKDAETNLKQEIDKCLAGADNVQKIFYTKFAVDPNTGEPVPGWKINELKGEIKDSSWLNAFSTAAAAIVTAHGVPPSLSNLVLSNSLNVGSGSDTREKFNFYMQLHTVIPRQTTLEWWEFVKRFNGWPEDIHLGYENIILQSVNENKSGYMVMQEADPTSNQTETKNAPAQGDSGN